MSMEFYTENKSTAPKANTHVQLLTFKLDEQEYALDIANVVRVVRMVAVTRAPRASDAVEGMINLRGKVIPVVDIRKRCGLPVKEHDLNTQLLIAQASGHMVALTVDVVSEVLTMPVANIESTQNVGAEMEFLSSVGKLGDRLILILDPKQVLTQQEAALVGAN